KNPGSTATMYSAIVTASPTIAIRWRRNAHHTSCHCEATASFAGATSGSSSAAGIGMSALLKANPRIDQRQQDVADQRADDGQRPDQQDEGAGQVHVLAHQRLQ